MTNGTNTYAGTQYDALGNPTVIGGTFARNDPWTGWLRDAASDDMITLILPGNGVWLNTQLTPHNDWISVVGVIPDQGTIHETRGPGVNPRPSPND